MRFLHGQFKPVSELCYNFSRERCVVVILLLVLVFYNMILLSSVLDPTDFDQGKAKAFCPCDGRTAPVRHRGASTGAVRSSRQYIHRFKNLVQHFNHCITPDRRDADGRG